MRISVGSSDVCASDLFGGGSGNIDLDLGVLFEMQDGYKGVIQALGRSFGDFNQEPWISLSGDDRTGAVTRSEEHTSELQSLMRISYAVFCLKKKKNKTQITKSKRTNMLANQARVKHINKKA